MKLKNKLLPLVGIGAACAAVTPIALTSCKNKTGMVDLVFEYKSQIDDIPGVARYTEDDVNTLYFSSAKNNPKIFANDLYWYRSMANKILYNNPEVSSQTSTDIENGTTTGADDEDKFTPDNALGLTKEGTKSDKIKVVTGGGENQTYVVVDNNISQPEKEKLIEGADSAYETKDSYNVTSDLESINLTNLKKETITLEESGKKIELWLASFTEEFDIVYDGITTTKDLLDIQSDSTTPTVNTAQNVCNKGTITFTNIPVSVWYNPGVIKAYDKTIVDKNLAGLWGISIDDRGFNSSGEIVYNDYGFINYVINSGEYKSSIKFDVTSSKNIVETVVGIGSTVKKTDTDYKFTIDDSFSLSKAKEVDIYKDALEQSMTFGYSYYLWNIDCKM